MAPDHRAEKSKEDVMDIEHHYGNDISGWQQNSGIRRNKLLKP